ncbi:hypothetical protein ABIB82_007811 [Bradyrhizobium sp. i1.8.4]
MPSMPTSLVNWCATVHFGSRYSCGAIDASAFASGFSESAPVSQQLHAFSRRSSQTQVLIRIGRIGAYHVPAESFRATGIEQECVRVAIEPDAIAREPSMSARYLWNSNIHSRMQAARWLPTPHSVCLCLE